MERSLVFIILGIGVVWLILDEIYGKKKIISGIVRGIME